MVRKLAKNQYSQSKKSRAIVTGWTIAMLPLNEEGIVTISLTLLTQLQIQPPQLQLQLRLQLRLQVRLQLQLRSMIGVIWTVMK